MARGPRPFVPVLAAAALLAFLWGAAGPVAVPPPPLSRPASSAPPRRVAPPPPKGRLQTPWDEEDVGFKTIEEAKKTLSEPDLLAKWGKRAVDVLAMVDFKVGGRVDLSDAMAVAENLGPLHVYFVGETGGGKSTLITSLAEGVAKDDIPVEVSATTPTECDTTGVPLPCGLVLVDTRGNRIPVPPVALDQPSPITDAVMRRYLYSRQLARWEYSLRSLRRTVEETEPAKMPAAAVVYVHRAGTRLVVDRMVEILSVPHSHNVPTFFVLSDVNSVDDAELEEIRTVMADIVDQVGINGRGRIVQKLEVNSVSKTVQDVSFAPSGLPELVASLLNSFRPVDILQFLRVKNPLQRGADAAAETARMARSSLAPSQ